MKKLLIVAVTLVMVMGLAGGAFAAGSFSKGNTAFSVGFGDSILGQTGVAMITGKYFIDRDMAVLAGFGLQTSSGDYDSNFFGFNIGARKYLKTDDLATFLQGMLSYEKVKVTAPGFTAVNEKVIDISGGFGAEYFFSRQFSVEGSVGIGIGMVDEANNTDYSYIGTRTAGVSANFYF